MFLVGGKVKGGLVGQYPSLAKLGDGDLIYNTDFRSVYATLLDRWLGCPPETVLGKPFPTARPDRGCREVQPSSTSGCSVPLKLREFLWGQSDETKHRRTLVSPLLILPFLGTR